MGLDPAFSTHGGSGGSSRQESSRDHSSQGRPESSRDRSSPGRYESSRGQSSQGNESFKNSSLQPLSDSSRGDYESSQSRSAVQREEDERRLQDIERERQGLKRDEHQSSGRSPSPKRGRFSSNSSFTEIPGTRIQSSDSDSDIKITRGVFKSPDEKSHGSSRPRDRTERKKTGSDDEIVILPRAGPGTHPDTLGDQGTSEKVRCRMCPPGLVLKSDLEHDRIHAQLMFRCTACSHATEVSEIKLCYHIYGACIHNFLAVAGGF